MITFHGLITCRCLSRLNDHVSWLTYLQMFINTERSRISCKRFCNFNAVILYQHQFVNVNNNNYTCCAKMAGKEETPKCRKKTVTWTNEMIEDLIDFIEIHPIVAFEAIYEPMLTSFWSLISFAVQLYIIMQYKGQHPPLLPTMPFCLLYLPPKIVCIHQNFLHRVYTSLNSSFLEWRLGCKTCIVYTGL